MRVFHVEVSPLGGSGEFGVSGRVIKVEAEKVDEALKKASPQMNHGEEVYQVCTAIEGRELPQPVWDYFNGNISRFFGLKL